MPNTAIDSPIAQPDLDSHPLDLPGIVAALGELKSGAIVTEEGIAHLFKRHTISVKRAIQRGELPVPCRLFGGNIWTAGALIQYIEQRLEQAAAEDLKFKKKMADLAP